MNTSILNSLALDLEAKLTLYNRDYLVPNSEAVGGVNREVSKTLDFRANYDVINIAPLRDEIWSNDFFVSKPTGLENLLYIHYK